MVNDMLNCCSYEPHWHFGKVCCRRNTCIKEDYGVIFHRHRRERIYVGPHSSEIVLNLRRPYGAGLYNELDVTLKVHRKRCGDQPVAEIKPYASDKTTYFFSVSGEFFTDSVKFPKGFYIGDVVIDDCVVDTIEIIKSPGIYAAQAKTTNGACFEVKSYKDTYCPIEDCIESSEEKEEEEIYGRKPCQTTFITPGKAKTKYVPPIDDLMEAENA